MHEPILYNKPMDKEVIRFTWLRTFHNPIAIRIEKSSQGITMYWKRCDGAGGYEPGKLIANKKKGITEEQWQQLMSLLDKASFWNPVLEEEEIGFDGAQWIVEAAGGDFYHVMHTWSGG
ncbi:MAG: hypothetical protein LBN06_10560, partial [Prevotellaceae bacterium]|nr:hypothetical protein [Prevotellaceae bacterium]